MSLEKRLIAAVAKCLAMLLLTCTVEAQLIYRRLLPRTQAVEAVYEEAGYRLPETALFTCPEGTCVYRIQEKRGRFGPEYHIKAVLVTVEMRDAGSVWVRGIYSPDWLYAAGATAPLTDGAEVLLLA